MATRTFATAALSAGKAVSLGAPPSSSLIRSLRQGSFASAPCLRCQRRALSVSQSRRDTKAKAAGQPELQAPAPAPASVSPPSPLANVPRSYGERPKEFTPTPLSRPIGMPLPPLAGENSGIDFRTMRQRRDDFVDYEKHLVRRQELKNKIIKPYFRDWTNLQFHKGKTFIAPPRLFRADLSLYFPNIMGERLLSADKSVTSELADTTPILQQSAASVVAMFSSLWAENQVRSFVSPEANPALAELLNTHADNAAGDGSGNVQLVRLNVEENAMRAWLVRRFSGSQRRRIEPRDWEKYLLVTRGISDEIRESIGLLNSKVGYVYLVDRHCRIRWAGSGGSQPDECQSLVRGIRRLLAEAKNENQLLQQQRQKPALSESQGQLARSTAA